MTAMKTTQSKKSAYKIYLNRSSSNKLTAHDLILTVYTITTNSVKGLIELDETQDPRDLLNAADFYEKESVAFEITRSQNRRFYAHAFTLTTTKPITIANINDLHLNFKAPVTLTKPPLYFNIFSEERSPDEFAFHLAANGLFDLDFYNSNLDKHESLTFFEAIAHYFSSGYKSGLNPNYYFSTYNYLKLNPDVTQVNLKPIEHFLLYGLHEDRLFSTNFNKRFYEQEYGSEIPDDIPSIIHFLKIGRELGFKPNEWRDIKPTKGSKNTSTIFNEQHYAREKLPNKILSQIYAKKPDQQKSEKSNITIIMPFYKEPSLIHYQRHVFEALMPEIGSMNVEIFAILDSPDDQLTLEEFKRFVHFIGKHTKITQVINEVNIGYLNSVNLAMKYCIAENKHAFLLNSDCFLTPNCLTTMYETLLSDDHIGFVNPLSSNATICTFPIGNLSWERKYNIYKNLNEYLPKRTFIPTAVGFCMLIKNRVLNEIGLFDRRFGSGYDEENDYVFRANKYGYRAVVANHAYAFHIGEQSFSQAGIQIDNTAILNTSHPEYKETIKCYENSFSAEYYIILSQIFNQQDTRVRILIDADCLGPYHNGTSDFILKFYQAAAELDKKYDLYIRANNEAAKFHNLEKNFSGKVCNSIGRDYFKHIIKLGQPQTIASVIQGMKQCLFYHIFMLDPIAIDCAYISNYELREAWETALLYSDGIFFQSKTTEKLFKNRYDFLKQKNCFVSHHSLEVADYDFASYSDESRKFPIDAALLKGRDFILIVGNHFHHKDILRTFDVLAHNFPATPIVLLGGNRDIRSTTHRDVTVFESGNLDQEFMQFLYSNCSVIVFPSHYEGFGFPTIYAAKYNKALVIRDLEISREICRSLDYENVYYFDNINDIAHATQKALSSRGNTSIHKTRDKRATPQTWKSSAIETLRFMESLNFSEGDLRRRISYAKLLEYRYL